MTTDPDCIFCRIAAGSIPATIVFQDEGAVAFRDISPQAPTHLLVIPREHITSISQVTDADAPVVGHLLSTVAKVARQEGIEGSGYRTVINCGRDAGQAVDHLHVHVIGGRGLHWPPG